MEKQFELIFLEEVFEYLKSIEVKHSEKIIYNIRKVSWVFTNLLFVCRYSSIRRQ